MVYSLRLSTDPSGGRKEKSRGRIAVEPDESFENALKRFRKQCDKAGLLTELTKRQHYENTEYAPQA
jgi:Ribosomal protein S21